MHKNRCLDELITNGEISDVVFCFGELHNISGIQSFVTKLLKMTKQ